MHTVELLEEALDFASRAGIELRQEWLGESPAGLCRIGAKWALFVNLSLKAEEQLSQVADALHAFPDFPENLQISPELRTFLLNHLEEATGK